MRNRFPRNKILYTSRVRRHSDSR